MAQKDFEIEIKTLIGNADAAQKLRDDLKTLDSSVECVGTYTQLNHYFEGGDVEVLAENLKQHLDEDTVDKMNQIVKEGKNISVRTREMKDEAKIVMKASIGDDSSSNGIMRMEIEATVPGFTLDALDEEVLKAGYSYQAKWSLTRE